MKDKEKDGMMNMNDKTPLTVENADRYVSESDIWDGPSEQDMQDYLTGNLLTERPNFN